MTQDPIRVRNRQTSRKALDELAVACDDAAVVDHESLLRMIHASLLDRATLVVAVVNVDQSFARQQTSPGKGERPEKCVGSGGNGTSPSYSTTIERVMKEGIER